MSDWLPLPHLLTGHFHNGGMRLNVTLIAFRMFLNGLEYLSTSGSVCPVGMFEGINPA